MHASIAITLLTIVAATAPALAAPISFPSPANGLIPTGCVAFPYMIATGVTPRLPTVLIHCNPRQQVLLNGALAKALLRGEARPPQRFTDMAGTQRDVTDVEARGFFGLFDNLAEAGMGDLLKKGLLGGIASGVGFNAISSLGLKRREPEPEPEPFGFGEILGGGAGLLGSDVTGHVLTAIESLLKRESTDIEARNLWTTIAEGLLSGGALAGAGKLAAKFGLKRELDARGFLDDLKNLADNYAGDAIGNSPLGLATGAKRELDARGLFSFLKNLVETTVADASPALGVVGLKRELDARGFFSDLEGLAQTAAGDVAGMSPLAGALGLKRELDARGFFSSLVHLAETAASDAFGKSPVGLTTGALGLKRELDARSLNELD